MQSLGQLARVVKVLPSGDVRISVSGRRWIFNPACLKRAPGEKVTETVGMCTAYLLCFYMINTNTFC